jgi:phage terminase large subunit
VTATERIASWRTSPLAFVREAFAIEPDAWQTEMLEGMAGTRAVRRECMKACTGPGKSAVLAWIGWWRLLCFAEPGEHPKGAAVSITADNLKDNLWAELSKWQARSPLLLGAFTWTKERIFAKDHPQTWFLSARAFSQDADADSIGRTLSGLHSKFAFVLLDETGDMPTAVLRSAEQIFTGSPIDAGIFMAGNPSSTTGALYAACNQHREQWRVTTITADPDDPKRTPRVDIELAREQIRLYGKDNPWVMSTILGLFPPGAFNSLLSIDEVEAAMRRHYPQADYEWSQKRLGVDVARQGDDRTVLFPRQGKAAFTPVIMRGATGPQVASRVAQAKTKWGQELELVDGTGGYGAGVVDALRVGGIAAVEVQFAGRANDPRYANKRAEMWFLMAEWVKAGGALPQIPELVRELTGPTYMFQNGRFQLEPKEQIKKRLGWSPDLADALALTFGMPDMPASAGALGGWGIHADGDARKSKHEYDPFA